MDQKPQSRRWGPTTPRPAPRDSGLPLAWRTVPPLVYGAAALGLRGDSLDPGAAALVLLGVLWLALHGTRTQLLGTLAASTGVLLGPVVVEPGGLAAGELSRAVIWTTITVLVGLMVSHLVQQTRRAANDAAHKAAVLLERETTLRSVSELARRMFAEPNARDAVCRAAAQVAHADRITLLEPDDRRRLTVSATCGVGPVADPAGSGAWIAFSSGQTFVVPDTSAAEVVGADRSVVFQPVLREAAATALLVVAWRSPRDVVSDHVLAALELLAAEAAVAIERADLMAELAVQARSDALTGLGNRRRWDERLEHDLALARRSREPLSVALLDLDRFKHFNDRYGHQAGDRLLKEASAAWRNLLRGSDTLVRWGGEEFAVLLPRCSAAEAHALLERLRARTPAGQTCSAGVAEWDREESPEALVDRADRALYEAKRRGRDQVVTASRVLCWEDGGSVATLDVDLGEHPLPA